MPDSSAGSRIGQRMREHNHEPRQLRLVRGERAVIVSRDARSLFRAGADGRAGRRAAARHRWRGGLAVRARGGRRARARHRRQSGGARARGRDGAARRRLLPDRPACSGSAGWPTISRDRCSWATSTGSPWCSSSASSASSPASTSRRGDPLPQLVEVGRDIGHLSARDVRGRRCRTAAVGSRPAT